MSVSIKYKGSEIASMAATGTKTLLTSGKYCEADIVVENTESGGGGGDHTAEDGIISGSITEYTNDRITEIRAYAFFDCKLLRSFGAQYANVIGNRALSGCSVLESVSLPRLSTIGTYAFAECPALTEVTLPQVKQIPASAFRTCTALTRVDLPSIQSIAIQAFYGCSALDTLIMRDAYDVCGLNTTALNGTALKNGTGYIYVPRQLVSLYKADTAWSAFANQIRAIEDYPAITGG